MLAAVAEPTGATEALCLLGRSGFLDGGAVGSGVLQRAAYASGVIR